MHYLRLSGMSVHELIRAANSSFHIVSMHDWNNTLRAFGGVNYRKLHVGLSRKQLQLLIVFRTARQ